MRSVECFVEMDVGGNEMKEALLDLRWETFPCVRWSIDKVVIRCVIGSRFLKLAEEKVVPAFVVALRSDRSRVIDSVELGLEAFLDLVYGRCRSVPCLGVKETSEGPLQSNLPLNTDEVEKKTIDNFRVGESPVKT